MPAAVPAAQASRPGWLSTTRSGSLDPALPIDSISRTASVSIANGSRRKANRSRIAAITRGVSATVAATGSARNVAMPAIAPPRTITSPTAETPAGMPNRDMERISGAKVRVVKRARTSGRKKLRA